MSTTMPGAGTSTLRRVRLAPQYVAYVLIALSTIALWPSLTALGRIWVEMADYWHGPLVAIICVIWLFRVQRTVTADIVRPMPAALPVLAATILAWMVAFRANSELAQQLVIPLIPALAILAVQGPQVLRRWVPPLAFLYFAIPIWEQAVPFLQWLSTHVAEDVLSLLNVPVNVEGNNVTIPAGTFSIIEGCSGRRYVVTGLACAYLAGHIHHLRGKRFLALMAISTVAALVTNWVRVVVVIYAGHVSNMQSYLVAVEHRSLGYALFIPLLIVIGYAAYRLGSHDAPGEETAPGADLRAASSTSALSAPTVAFALVLLALPILIWGRPVTPPAVAPAVRSLPVFTGDWQGPLPASGKWRPYFVGAASEYTASYADAGHRIDVYLNAYGLQSAGRELIFHRNSVVPTDQWTTVKPVPTAAAAPAMVVAATLAGERWVVAKQYSVGGWTTPSPAVAQLYSGVRALWKPTPAGAIAFATPCGSDCEAAAHALQKFWNDNGAILLTLIPTTFD